MNSARISILKTVLVIIFREVSAHANETRVGKGCDIAMAHCRSLQGSSWFSNDGTPHLEDEHGSILLPGKGVELEEHCEF